MENKFKNILKISKAWETQESKLSKTFYGDLHKASSWFFSFNNLDSVEIKEAKKEVTNPVVVPPVVENKINLESNNFKMKVLFIGDVHDEKSEDLLGKMIVAMKLSPGEFHRVQFDEELENVFDVAANLKNPSPESAKLFAEIHKSNPQVIVTLGATVSNILLGKREKLSTIHGQFYTFEHNGAHQFMPLFHPDYLKINPNMKKAAWVDLQKVMKLIGKI